MLVRRLVCRRVGLFHRSRVIADGFHPGFVCRLCRFLDGLRRLLLLVAPFADKVYDHADAFRHYSPNAAFQEIRDKSTSRAADSSKDFAEFFQRSRKVANVADNGTNGVPHFRHAARIEERLKQNLDDLAHFMLSFPPPWKNGMKKTTGRKGA